MRIEEERRVAAWRAPRANRRGQLNALIPFPEPSSPIKGAQELVGRQQVRAAKPFHHRHFSQPTTHPLLPARQPFAAAAAAAKAKS